MVRLGSIASGESIQESSNTVQQGPLSSACIPRPVSQELAEIAVAQKEPFGAAFDSRLSAGRGEGYP